MFENFTLIITTFYNSELFNINCYKSEKMNFKNDSVNANNIITAHINTNRKFFNKNNITKFDFLFEIEKTIIILKALKQCRTIAVKSFKKDFNFRINASFKNLICTIFTVIVIILIKLYKIIHVIM